MHLDRLSASRITAFLLALGLLAVLTSPAAAQPDTWNNGGGDFRWFNVNNWSLGAVPTSANAATFTGTATGTVLLNTGTTGGAATAGSLAFSGGPYAIGNGTAGDSLTIAATTGTNLTNSAGSNTINAQLIASALSASITGGSLTLANTAAGGAANSLTGTVTVGSGGTLTALIAGTVGTG